jgi:mannonate dehydratase
VRRIFSLAEQYQVRAAPHGPTDLSPVNVAASLHLDLAVPNFGFQAHMRQQPLVDEVFPHVYSFSEGYLHPGEKPGLGVELDEALAARYPYEPAYLPIARLTDGGMHDW